MPVSKINVIVLTACKRFLFFGHSKGHSLDRLSSPSAVSQLCCCSFPRARGLFPNRFLLSSPRLSLGGRQAFVVVSMEKTPKNGNARTRQGHTPFILHYQPVYSYCLNERSSTSRETAGTAYCTLDPRMTLLLVHSPQR